MIERDAHSQKDTISMITNTKADLAPWKAIQDNLWILDSTPWISDYRYWIADSLSVELRIPIVSGIRIPKAMFQIPKPKIPDSTSRNFPDSGIRIPLRGDRSILRKIFNLLKIQSPSLLYTFLTVSVVYPPLKNVIPFPYRKSSIKTPFLNKPSPSHNLPTPFSGKQSLTLTGDLLK